MGFAICGVAITVMAAGCASKPKNLREMTVGDANLSSPTGSYLVIHFGPKGAEMAPKPCSTGGLAGGSAWDACPSTSQMLHFARTANRVYLSMEDLTPVYKTTANCLNLLGVGPEANGCDSTLHTRGAPSTAEVLGSAFTAFVFMPNTREMDPDKIRRFVGETWPESRRMQTLNQDLAYRGQRGARVAQAEAQQAEAKRVQQARLDAAERQRQAAVEQSKRNFAEAQRLPLRVGIPICTANNQFGYVEQLAGDRVMVSTRTVFYRDPNMRSTWMHDASREMGANQAPYLMFSDRARAVRIGNEVNTRWDAREAWAACPIDIR